jgi:hypothetical protein
LQPVALYRKPRRVSSVVPIDPFLSAPTGHPPIRPMIRGSGSAPARPLARTSRPGNEPPHDISVTNADQPARNYLHFWAPHRRGRLSRFFGSRAETAVPRSGFPAGECSGGCSRTHSGSEAGQVRAVCPVDRGRRTGPRPWLSRSDRGGPDGRKVGGRSGVLGFRPAASGDDATLVAPPRRHGPTLVRAWRHAGGTPRCQSSGRGNRGLPILPRPSLGPRPADGSSARRGGSVRSADRAPGGSRCSTRRRDPGVAAGRADSRGDGRAAGGARRQKLRRCPAALCEGLPVAGCRPVMTALAWRRGARPAIRASRGCPNGAARQRHRRPR